MGAYLGSRSLRAATDLQKKLGPLIAVVGNLPDKQIAYVAAWVKRKMKEASDAEEKLEKAGL